ncbi:HAD-IA family hydrolase [Amycolatopsis jiangsuensis]|uniref:HAD superfamily hydrolase (TIGR01509 family) n=1 Tax=Amycolatopsis jiangsuensis TaxID=1181879 RepID=A0A840J0C2_9PSEU|nr:HAD-IA family hydrolase [Amycolatopsis jiangsuensis]MBB4688561.1 HAD superfamily hydrolase (TIGR01509 family) [Amycolatopsis jiangsuensis]
MLKGLLVDYAGVLTDPDAHLLYDYLRAARVRGTRTALVSNAPGAAPGTKAQLAPYFDTLVFSGEVGVAKPSREIYLVAAERLGLAAASCAFVDDSERNVRGAADAGLAGVHHVSVPGTLEELAVLFS